MMLGELVDGLNSASPEELDSFIQIRRCVKRMQAGTPLLLRTLSPEGHEDLQICTFSVSKDSQTLCWQDREGTGSTHEVSLSSVIRVEEDPENTSGDAEDCHHALLLTLQGGFNEEEEKMDLICATPEDLQAWRDGLRFLISSAPLPPTPAGVRASPVAASRTDQELRHNLLQEKEANAKLRKENDILREQLKRKDGMLAECHQKLQQQQGSAERLSKTASSSRESDDHLREREVIALRSKNGRLRKALRAKQQTVKELLQLVGKLTAQQGAESSAVEEADDDEALEDSDCLEEEQTNSVRGGASTASSQPTRGGSGRATVAATAGAIAAAVPSSAPTVQDQSTDGNDSGEEAEALQEEMMALASKLARLEDDLAAARSSGAAPSQAASAPAAFRPPPRAGAKAAAATASPTAAASTAAMAARASPAAAAVNGAMPQAAAPQADDEEGMVNSVLAQLLGLGGADIGDALAGLASDDRSYLQELVGALAPEGARGAAAVAAPSPVSRQAAQPKAEPKAQAKAVARAPAATSSEAADVGRAVAARASAAALAEAEAARAKAAPKAKAGGGKYAPNAKGSTVALAALDRELEVLEEKKRMVEKLARQLEPPSDDDENDGFPLR